MSSSQNNSYCDGQEESLGNSQINNNNKQASSQISISLKNACVSHFLQVFCVCFIGVGLFFFQKQLSLVSHQDLKFVDREEWFEDPMHDQIVLLVFNSNINFHTAEEQSTIDSQLPFEIPSNIFSKILSMSSEPECFQGQEISSLMTGTHSQLLDYVYSQEQLIEDSILHQMNHTQKITEFLGESNFWTDLFPNMQGVAEYENAETLKKILTSTTPGASLVIGMADTQEDQEKILQGLSASLPNITLSTLILLINKPPCSIYSTSSSQLLALSNIPFQSTLQFNQTVPIEEIDLTSTICAMLGVPIPFSNFGSVIPQLYPENMELELSGLYTNQTRQWYTALYHIVLNTHQVQHYLIEFQKRYPSFFDASEVAELKGEINALGVKFTEFGKRLVQDNVTEIIDFDESDSMLAEKNNSDLNSTEQKEELRVNLNLELESEMKAEIIKMKDVLRRIDDVISRSNYGQIHVMITGYFMLIIAICLLIRSELKGNRGFLRQIFKKLVQSKDSAEPQFQRLSEIIISAIMIIPLITINQKQWMLLSLILAEISLQCRIQASCVRLVVESIILVFSAAWQLGMLSHFSSNEIISKTIIFLSFICLLSIYSSVLWNLRTIIKKQTGIYQLKKTLYLNCALVLNMISLATSAVSASESEVTHQFMVAFTVGTVSLSGIMLKIFISSTDNNNSFSYLFWLLIGLTFIPIIIISSHSPMSLFSILIFFFQIYHLFHLSSQSNNGTDSSNKSQDTQYPWSYCFILSYLLAITGLLAHSLLSHSIELVSLKGSIHLDHELHSHHQKAHQNEGVLHRVLNILPMIEFSSLLSNFLLISGPSLLLAFAIPVYQCLLKISSSKTIQGYLEQLISDSQSKEYLQDQSRQMKISQTDEDEGEKEQIIVGYTKYQQVQQPVEFSQQSNDQHIISSIQESNVKLILQGYIFVALVTFSSLSFVVIQLILGYSSTSLNSFRICKELFIFRAINFIVLPYALLTFSRYFLVKDSNNTDATDKDPQTQQFHNSKKSSQDPSSELVHLSTIDDSSFSISNRSISS